MPESERAVFKIFIRGSIEAVWHEITKTDEPQLCMFNMRLDTDGLQGAVAVASEIRKEKRRSAG